MYLFRQYFFLKHYPHFAITIVFSSSAPTGRCVNKTGHVSLLAFNLEKETLGWYSFKVNLYCAEENIHETNESNIEVSDDENGVELAGYQNSSMHECRKPEHVNHFLSDENGMRCAAI